MKVMRTIPVIMNITQVMERLATDAWLINFSNPSGLVAEAVLNNTNVKMIGLCNDPINMINNAKALIQEDVKKFDYDFVGLNHLCWITSIYAEGYPNTLISDMLFELLSITSKYDYMDVLTESINAGSLKIKDLLK